MSSTREPARMSRSDACASAERACACASSSRREPFLSSSTCCASALRVALAERSAVSALSSSARAAAPRENSCW